MLELAAMKRSQQGGRAPSSHSRHSSLGHSPPDSPFCSTPDSALSRGECTTALSTPVTHSVETFSFCPGAEDGMGLFPSRGSSGEQTRQEGALLLHDSHHPFKSHWLGGGGGGGGVSSHSLPRNIPTAHHHKSSPSPQRLASRKRIRRSTSVTDLTTGGPYTSRRGGPAPTNHNPSKPPISNHEIERIIAKIQQDNKILAELDKHANVSGSSHPRNASTQPPRSAGSGRRRTLPKKPSASSHRLIPKIRIDSETGSRDYSSPGTSYEQRRSYTLSGAPGPSKAHPPTANVQNMSHALPPFQQIATVLPTNFFLPAGTQIFPTTGPSHSAITMGGQPNPNLIHHLPGGQMSIPTIITSHVHKSDRNQQGHLLNGSHVVLGKSRPIEQSKSVDVLDIPGKGRCFVYIARYSYDPFHQSPNENPESELYLNAGDYILVWGTMDEDGFLDGELLDGRRGLVPSNYVERLLGEDLLEFHQQVVLGVKDPHEDALSSSMQDFDMGRDAQQVDESQRLVIVQRSELCSRGKRSLPPLVLQGDFNDSALLGLPEELMNRRKEEYSYLDLEDMIEDDSSIERQDVFFSVLVPPPLQLTLERQLNKSILIAWTPPDCPPDTIDSYQVYVNGLLRCTIKANERTRALVEGVDSNRPHRISVRSVTPNRRTSRDAACTMVIGKDAPLSPSCVRVTNVTSTSAVISWLPSNSNYQHVVSVNNVEVRTVKPGVYRHMISVLTPNTSYRVTVRSKNIKAQHFDEKSIKQMEKLCAHTEFRTLPKGCLGLPDPPLDVQVEPGPQDNTLLVTWHPVTAGTSNGAVVTGYAVFADGRKVLEIDSPSGDHALLDLTRFQGVIPRQVTVRTKSRDSLSSDSIPIPIPAQVLKGRRYSKTSQMTNSGGRRYRPKLAMEGDESFSDREMEQRGGYGGGIPAIEVTSDTDRHYVRPGMGPGRGRPGMASGHAPHHHPLPDRPHTARGYHGPGRGSGARPPPEDPYREQQPGGVGYGRERGRPGRGGARLPSEVRHRLFVALFDYDPPTMSPNPDACDEELPFREGQMIKIYGEKDPDGFYWGEAGGRRGYVPCNMVSEVHADDERAAQELLNQQQHDVGEGVVSGRERRAMGRERWGDIYATTAMKKMVALYDYDPQELSPNVDSEVELSFRTGDIIYVYGDMDDDGFYMGELNGVRGLVPSNFLTEAPSDFDRGGGGGGPGPSSARRQAPHLGPPPDQRRGGLGGPPGPGARGPPPPPREGPPPPHRPPDGGRRKDAAYPLDFSAESPSRNQYEGAAGGRRGGRGGGPFQQPRPRPGEGPPLPHQPPEPGDGGNRRSLRGIPAVVPQFSPTQMDPTAEPGAHPPNNRPTPAAPAGGGGGFGFGLLSKSPFGGDPSPAAGGPPGSGPPPSKLPGVFTDTPSNLMAKFTEFTHSATGGGAGGETSILSKGKELIFKKFGLGD